MMSRVWVLTLESCQNSSSFFPLVLPFYEVSAHESLQIFNQLSSALSVHRQGPLFQGRAPGHTFP